MNVVEPDSTAAVPSFAPFFLICSLSIPTRSTVSDVNMPDLSSFSATSAPTQVPLSNAPVIFSYVASSSVAVPSTTVASSSILAVFPYVGGPSIAGFLTTFAPISNTPGDDYSFSFGLVSARRSSASIFHALQAHSHARGAVLSAESFAGGSANVSVLDAVDLARQMAITKCQRNSAHQGLAPITAKLHKYWD